jgi:hypothetical protein
MFYLVEFTELEDEKQSVFVRVPLVAAKNNHGFTHPCPSVRMIGIQN